MTIDKLAIGAMWIIVIVVLVSVVVYYITTTPKAIAFEEMVFLGMMGAGVVSMGIGTVLIFTSKPNQTLK